MDRHFSSYFLEFLLDLPQQHLILDLDCDVLLDIWHLIHKEGDAVRSIGYRAIPVKIRVVTYKDAWR